MSSWGAVVRLLWVCVWLYCGFLDVSRCTSLKCVQLYISSPQGCFLHACICISVYMCLHCCCVNTLRTALCHTYFNSLWTWSDILGGKKSLKWVILCMEGKRCSEASGVSFLFQFLGSVTASLQSGPSTRNNSCNVQAISIFLSANFGGIENSLKVLVKFRPFWIYMKQLSWGIDGSRCSFLHFVFSFLTDVGRSWHCSSLVMLSI